MTDGKAIPPKDAMQARGISERGRVGGRLHARVRRTGLPGQTLPTDQADQVVLVEQERTLISSGQTRRVRFSY